MPVRVFRSPAVLLLACLCAAPAAAQGTAILLQDINPGNIASAPTFFFDTRAFGTVGYFTAQGPLGYELWKTDGTPAGTALVRDIRPGPGASFPNDFAMMGGRLFFSAAASNGSRELWTSDGTEAGTVAVTAINVGPSRIIAWGGTLYFTGMSPATGAELWKSDGTAAGTVLVRDIAPGTAHSEPGLFTPFRGRLFFRAYVAGNGIDQELMSTDGTTAGTVLVKDIAPGAFGSMPANFTVIGDTMFFTASTLAEGTELWKTDGTAGGTVIARDIVPGTGSGLQTSARLQAVGNVVFFEAFSAAGGYELWKSDGTTAGTVQVLDLNPGAANASPLQLNDLDGTLLFTAINGTNGRELWKSDGTAAGTVLVRDVRPGASSGAPSFVTALPGAGRALFLGNDGISGEEVWRTDGTAAGTVLHQDVWPGNGFSSPGPWTLAGPFLLMQARTLDEGTEPYAMPGMACGVPYGFGCPGTGGRTPVIAAGGVPAIGNASFGFRVSQARPGSSAFLFVGFSATDLVLGSGCVLYVNLSPLFLGFATATDGSGVGFVPVPVPGEPLLAGHQLFAQFAVLDPASPFSGLALTSGLKIVLAPA
jgi:ELWxxDGT repeat protein